MFSLDNDNQVIDIAKSAGKEILRIYNKTYSVNFKEDSSPLTEADIKSHNLITKELKKIFPDIKIISEESKLDQDRHNWDTYWLIDPLDGTKEFINRNDEFTVNIALIHNNKPVWGVVYAPALDVIYWGGQGISKKQFKNNPPQTIKASNKTKKQNYKIVGSRSHQSKDFSDFISRFVEPEIVSMGSSLKLCMVADGIADIYPRFGLTSEWDTAAANAVVNGSGGEVVEIDSFNQLKYNKVESILNPFFIVGSSNILEDIKKYL